jgi:hypothetical protein
MTEERVLNELHRLGFSLRPGDEGFLVIGSGGEPVTTGYEGPSALELPLALVEAFLQDQLREKCLFVAVGGAPAIAAAQPSNGRQ